MLYSVINPDCTTEKLKSKKPSVSYGKKDAEGVARLGCPSKLCQKMDTLGADNLFCPPTVANRGPGFLYNRKVP